MTGRKEQWQIGAWIAMGRNRGMSRQTEREEANHPLPLHQEESNARSAATSTKVAPCCFALFSTFLRPPYLVLHLFSHCSLLCCITLTTKFACFFVFPWPKSLWCCVPSQPSFSNHAFSAGVGWDGCLVFVQRRRTAGRGC